MLPSRGTVFVYGRLSNQACSNIQPLDLIYRKKKYGFNNEMIKVDGGAFGDKTELIPIYKIQAVKLVQSIYQRRHDLASLELFTAAGSVRIPYIEVGDAHKISDFLMYKVEIDKRGWM